MVNLDGKTLNCSTIKIALESVIHIRVLLHITTRGWIYGVDNDNESGSG